MKAQFAGGLLLGFNFLWAVSALYGPRPVPIPRPPIGPIPGKGPMKFPGPGPAPIPFPGPPVPQVPIKRPALGPVPGPGPVIGPVEGPGFAVAEPIGIGFGNDVDEGIISYNEGVILSDVREPGFWGSIAGIKITIRFWRFKLVIRINTCSAGLRIRVWLFDRLIFNQCFGSLLVSFRLRIPRSIVPFWIRWLMRSDLFIYFTDLSSRPLGGCIQLKVKIRSGFLLLGTKTLKFPRRPYCFGL